MTLTPIDLVRIAVCIPLGFALYYMLYRRYRLLRQAKRLVGNCQPTMEHDGDVIRLTWESEDVRVYLGCQRPISTPEEPYDLISVKRKGEVEMYGVEEMVIDHSGRECSATQWVREPLITPSGKTGGKPIFFGMACTQQKELAKGFRQYLETLRTLARQHIPTH